MSFSLIPGSTNCGTMIENQEIMSTLPNLSQISKMSSPNGSVASSATLIYSIFREINIHLFAILMFTLFPYLPISIFLLVHRVNQHDPQYASIYASWPSSSFIFVSLFQTKSWKMFNNWCLMTIFQLLYGSDVGFRWFFLMVGSVRKTQRSCQYPGRWNWWTFASMGSRWRRG